jgi:type VI secretion system protein ImpK
MQPEFAEVVDPIFVASLKLEEQIERGESIELSSERNALIRVIEEAERRLNTDEEWMLAKYALCAWIDERMNAIPVNQRGVDKNWWKDHTLEKKFFNTWEAHEEFYQRAVRASQNGKKNALEVFYLCVVLGFRGFYNNEDATYRKQLLTRMRLPATIEDWCHETVQALHLRRESTIIPGSPIRAGSIDPLIGKRTLILYAMFSTLALSLAIGCALILFP